MLDAKEAEIAALRQDALRLDFVLTKDAFVMKAELDHPGIRWQLWTQDEDENYTVLSGDRKSFATAREAIDADMAQAVQPS